MSSSAGSFKGMNPDVVRRCASAMDSAVRELGATQAAIGRLIEQLGRQWGGADFERFAGWWNTEHRPALRRAIDSVEGLAMSARNNADEQDRASGVSGSAPLAGPRPSQAINSGRVAAGLIAVEAALDTGGRGVRRDDLLVIQEVFSNLNAAEKQRLFNSLTPEQLAVLKDQMQESGTKGGLTAQQQATFLGSLLVALTPDEARRLMGEEWALIRHTTPDQIAGSTSGRELVSGLFDGLRHRPIASDEIEIRTLDDGSYIVMLPGVMDLSDGLKDGAVGGATGGGGRASVVSASAAVAGTWEGTNASDSARDMHYARQSEMQGHNGSQLGTNGYAFAVKQAMRAANIPDGADVMLVGHSFGAYTAAELAADQSFNDAFGASRLGYSVNITHVAAAGASAGFRMNELPTGTDGILLNNSGDLAYLGERAVPTNNTPNRSEIVFNGGSHDGVGHQPTHHGAFVRSANLDPLNSFNQSAFDNYGGPGSSVRVTVKDPFR